MSWCNVTSLFRHWAGIKFKLVAARFKPVKSLIIVQGSQQVFEQAAQIYEQVADGGARRAKILGGSGGMLPRKFLKF